MKPNPPPNLPRWKKFLFAILICVLFYAALELVLAICGVRPALYDQDPYVGFSSRLPLFVAKRAPDGSAEMATADNKLSLFNAQHFPRKKAAGTFRIFCLGGSTTYGHPYDDKTSFSGWLRELLPVVDPSRRWEVVNAGGVSYASYRMAMLMEELAAYEPDLFVIECGQNEFLERRTYARIIATPAAIRGLGALASRTRTWTALKYVIDGFSGRGSPGSESGTRLPGEVAAVLDRSIGPDAYARDDALRSQVLAHYRYSLARMVDIAHFAKAGIVLLTPASNIRDCSPFKSENTPGLTPAEFQKCQALVEMAQKAGQANHLEESLQALNQAVQIDPRHATLQFQRARTLDALGRFDEARAGYERAREEDVCPLRALTAMRAIVSEVASQRGVPLVDFAALVEKRAKDGIPGKDLFLDHVHPTIEMHRALALAIMEAMDRNGTLHPHGGLQSPWENDPDVRRATQGLESRIDRREHGAALRRLAMVMSWAGKFEDGYEAASRAVELAPDDLEAHYHLARCASILGRIPEAEEHFKRVLQADVPPASAPYYFAESHLNLGVLHEMRGQVDEAASEYIRAAQMRPDYAPPHNNLGALYKRRGDLARAEAEYRTALSLQPEFPEACFNLGVLLEGQGKLAEAETQYRRAIQLRPGYPKATARLGDLLRKQGR